MPYARFAIVRCRDRSFDCDRLLPAKTRAPGRLDGDFLYPQSSAFICVSRPFPLTAFLCLPHVECWRQGRGLADRLAPVGVHLEQSVGQFLVPGVQVGLLAGVVYRVGEPRPATAFALLTDRPDPGRSSRGCARRRTNPRKRCPVETRHGRRPEAPPSGFGASRWWGGF